LIAAEPPSAADADGLRDKRVEVFRAIPSADPNRYVRGQYDGYLSVPGVSPGSQTETFAALQLEVDNWRWSGVPFFIRAGKALAAQATEVRMIFKQPPRLAFAQHIPHPDEFILRIDPSPGADMMVQARQPGTQSIRTVDLSLIFSEELGEAPEPYERLLGDALKGTPDSSSGRTAWSRRGASCSPRWTRPLEPYTPGVLGAGRRRHAACRAPELA
jgi:glucose-6-phosphate 1-dehydrogenase